MSVEFASDGPRFVAPYRPNHGGVDFLGLRQVNLAMMALCLPGINNVTRYIRPFSVLTWIYWKFYLLSAPKDRRITEKDLRIWKEKVETLFTWGHKLHDVGGVPGTDSNPPGKGSVPLDFAAWKRRAQNTSLMAAVQYGPAAKTYNGLGFLEPLGRGFFQTHGLGVSLAEALDIGLRRFELFKSIESASANAKQAERIFPAWSINDPSPAERRVFRRALFDFSKIGETSSIGRRSTTMQLVLETLRQARRPLAGDDIRISMFRGGYSDPRITPTWLRWVVLQIRQCQRLAFEGLMSWLEILLIQGYRNTEDIVEKTLKVIAAHKTIFSTTKPGQAMKDLQKRLPTLTAALKCQRQLDPFALMDEILAAVPPNNSERLAPYCLKALLVCARFTQLLHDHSPARPELQRGGSERVSLHFWNETVVRGSEFELREFLLYLFERFILSQHFAVAARRFDGGTQRLRISIEEDGLEMIADEPLKPSVAQDRLYAVLSLMEDCRMIRWNEAEGGYYAV
jgi:hypothetical protein